MRWHREPIRCEVSPDVVRPGDAVLVRVLADRPVDKVAQARIELGYTNFYSYRWAGRADSAAAAATDALSLMGEVGTNYGAERSTSEWVSVLTMPVPVSEGRFHAAEVRIRVPSWAPASSPELVRWACRVRLDRRGRDVDVPAVFRVVVDRADPAAATDGTERLMGDASEIDIAIDPPVVRAGEPLRGLLTVTPRADLPDADIAVYWQRIRLSHPLTRTPGEGEAISGPVLGLAQRMPMPSGAPVRMPFELPVPAAAAPTAAAVHSSLEWYIAARIYYKGFSTMPERVRRAVIVVNAG
jgi:hypothetical protein